MNKKKVLYLSLVNLLLILLVVFLIFFDTFKRSNFSVIKGAGELWLIWILLFITVIIVISWYWNISKKIKHAHKEHFEFVNTREDLDIIER